MTKTKQSPICIVQSNEQKISLPKTRAHIMMTQLNVKMVSSHLETKEMRQYSKK